ncbi:MAG TPA: ABC transporter permease [Gemmataceae bacterium]|nr:ABC transporter permease [Gemmataceae bacterium]
MRKIFVIAVREYNAAVRTKAFLVSLVLLPVLMLGSFGVQAMLRDRVDTSPKQFAVIDRTRGEEVLRALEEKARERNENHLHNTAGRQVRPEYVLERVPPPDSTEARDALRLEQSERVRRGELAGIVEIGEDVDEVAPAAADLGDFEGPDPAPTFDERVSVRFQAHSHTSHEFTAWLRRSVSDVVEMRRFREQPISAEKAHELMRKVPLLARGLSARDPRTGEIHDGAEANRLASFFAPAGLVMLMFMMIFVGATPLMQGVIEEKSQRIAEVLLGSVRPFPLMLGKLLGTVGVATTLAVVYLGGAYAAARHFGVTEHLPARLIAWFLVYQTLGVLMYGSLFIAVGAACTSAQETQTMLLPVMLVAMMPLFVMTNVIMEPDGPLATGASLLPTAAPMLMLARLSVSPGLPLWQPLLGVVLVLLATLLCVWAAGRIFRVGLLAQGQAAGFREMMRWVWRG